MAARVIAKIEGTAFGAPDSLLIPRRLVMASVMAIKSSDIYLYSRNENDDDDDDDDDA